MKKFILKRLAISVATLLVLITVVFLLVRLMPGGPFMDPKMTPEVKARMEAYEYEGNTYDEDASYYAQYFAMRLNQCHVLHNLHYEMQKIKNVPDQAKVVVEYIRYLNQYVTELNDPVPQLQFLEEIVQRMKKEPLPVSREEFENRAVLYHILMDLEEFLIFKKRFVYKEGLIPAAQKTTA